MAYDDRYSGFRSRERGRWRDEPSRDWREEGRSWGDEIRDWFGGRRHDRDDARYEDEGAYGRAGFEPRDDFGRREDAGIRYGGASYDDRFGQSGAGQVNVGRSGAYGAQSLAGGAGYGFGADRRGGRDPAIRERDPHYSEWRRRQIDALDRDYDDYRRENQSRFDDEFGSWRNRRGEQREAVGRVNEHMEVVGADDSHVGTVDKVRGDSIVLTKNDAAAGGVHHRIPCGWVDRVDDKVRLNLTADQATERWRTESRSRALFEPEDSGSDGPHILNRSFSGTYREE